MGQKLSVVFGGGGFIGRYVTQALLNAGWRVRVASRNPASAWFLKPLGGLGQTQFAGADILKPAGVAQVVAGADAVINLVGILKGNFDAMHVTGAGNIARAAADAGAQALVHLSAIGADGDSPSAYGRSKAAGEVAVRAAFPDAAILRPSVVFGPEDQFINRFAALIQALPVVPVLKPETKFQPVYVGDVARAVVAALEPGAAGRTFELGGPEILVDAGPAQVDRRADPADAATAAAAGHGRAAIAALGFLPGAPLTRDQWLMLQRDNVVAVGSARLAASGRGPDPDGGGGGVHAGPLSQARPVRQKGVGEVNKPPLIKGGLFIIARPLHRTAKWTTSSPSSCSASSRA